jgi:aminoglycoside phosphotransferase (APT) family kinase protein
MTDLATYPVAAPVKSDGGLALGDKPMRALSAKAVSVGRHILAEKRQKPVARTINDVPVSGATVTPEWLTAVLCRNVPGARVLGFSNPGGSSGSSERLALRVTYNDAGRDAGLPTELFTKASMKYSQRMLMGGAGVLEGERHFYMSLRPKSTVEAPKGYCGAADLESWRSITVMEDIAATKGARFIDAPTPLTREQVADLVQNLARLHGGLWRDPDLAVLNTPRDYMQRTSAFLDLEKRCAVGLERAKAEIPRALHGQAERLHQATIRAMDIATDELPTTLLHGDCHVGQTYITGDGRMGISDWQIILQGGWAYDFAYLVNSACEPEDRRKWQHDLMELYLERLAEHGGEAPSFDDAWLAYRQQCFWPYSAWAITIGRAFYQPKMQPVPTCLAILRRTSAAIADLDAFDTRRGLSRSGI